MLADVVLARSATTTTRACAATTTDHRMVASTFISNSAPGGFKHGFVRGPARPIGWRLNDNTFNEQVLNALGRGYCGRGNFYKMT